MTTTSDAPVHVLRTAYQRSVADYWNKEKDPVNLRLGDVDGL
ncbi:SAM-dependent methyltransferase, partial [Streptomyces sp. NPDC049577]